MVLWWPDSIAEYRRNNELTDVFDEHDVGFVEFVLAEEKGFAIGREGQTTKESTWVACCGSAPPAHSG
jgi:hypothetical protein